LTGAHPSIRWVVALTVFVGVIACGPVAGGTPTASVCPPAPTTAIAPPSTATAAPTVYVFMVDRAFSANGKQSTSYPWPQLPTTALQVVGAVIPKLELRPGDVVFGGWISHNSNDPAEIFLPLTQVAGDPPVALVPSPTPVATPLNKLACNEYALRIAGYNSAAKSWQESADAQQAKQLAARQAAISAFTTTATSKVANATPQRDVLGTDVYGGLAVASGVFSVNPGARKLVLFSDLADTVQRSVRPDLAGTDVVVALYHRDDVGDQGQAQAAWRATLQKLGARSTTFIEWAATTPDKIAQLLGGPR
jgi:hypothetical protein